MFWLLKKSNPATVTVTRIVGERCLLLFRTKKFIAKSCKNMNIAAKQLNTL